MTVDQIESEALKLSAAQRARLAERLIASLDTEAEIESAWSAEVRGRDAELESGEVDGVPLAAALKAVRDRHGW